jgi:putative Mg2+ transporter-C (MgtC) family protein
MRMLGWTDIFLRLGAAMLIGGVLGLNRDLHHKPSGLRTLSLVSLGSAVAVLAVAQADISRVIQGVITGVGFIGAGMILHRPTGHKEVHGLTTAATIWVTAALVGWGLDLLAIAVPLSLALLVFGGSVEKWCHKLLGSDN